MKSQFISLMFLMVVLLLPAPSAFATESTAASGEEIVAPDPCATVKPEFESKLAEAMTSGISDKEVVKAILTDRSNSCVCEVFAVAMENGVSLKQMVAGALEAGVPKAVIASRAVDANCCGAEVALVAEALGVSELPGLGYTPANEAPPVAIIQTNPGGRNSVSPSSP